MKSSRGSQRSAFAAALWGVLATGIAVVAAGVISFVAQPERQFGNCGDPGTVGTVRTREEGEAGERCTLAALKEAKAYAESGAPRAELAARFQVLLGIGVPAVYLIFWLALRYRQPIYLSAFVAPAVALGFFILIA
jgi:hypothetical protein